MKTALALAALCLTALATPAAAQFIRYECLMDWVEGTSSPNTRENRAAREARTAWEGVARSREGVNYRWNRAQVIWERTSNRNGQWVGTARAYPCRVYVQGPNQGTLAVARTESERVCRSFPSFSDAERHSCTHFYPLRR